MLRLRVDLRSQAQAAPLRATQVPGHGSQSGPHIPHRRRRGHPRAATLATSVWPGAQGPPSAARGGGERVVSPHGGGGHRAVTLAPCGDGPVTKRAKDRGLSAAPLFAPPDADAHQLTEGIRSAASTFTPPCVDHAPNEHIFPLHISSCNDFAANPHRDDPVFRL